MELQFEPATAEDVETVFAQCKNLIDAYESVSEEDYRSILLWVTKKLKENIERYTRIRWNGEPVGYYCLREIDGKMELDDFYVLEPYRGKRIGSAVLEVCLSSASMPVFLYVFVKNTGAIRLYQRFGFRKVKDVGKTRWIMEWNPAK